MRGYAKLQCWILIIIIALAAGGCAARKETRHGTHADYGAMARTVIRDVPYVPGRESDRRLQLDIYSNPHDGLWPVVVVIHGGAWIMGSKEMDKYIFLSEALANHGYVSFNINYRLAPGAKIREQAEDAMAAVIWVKEHAGEYGGDPQRIGVTGGSAGGHLSALVAWASDDSYFRPTGYAGSKLDSDVLAAGLYFPVLDLEETLRVKTKIVEPLVRRVLVGGQSKDYQEQLKHISPRYHVDAQVPPTIILTGDRDSFKLYPQSVEYTKKLKDLGVDARLYTAAGKSHGFIGAYWEPETTESVKELIELFDQYLK